MHEVQKHTLAVPGANLYYEVRGSGPVLLMIHGGGGDADNFFCANHLADRYTVVTYDRRSHSRSQSADVAEAYRVETHSDDAHRLLATLTDEPAYVFSSSAGAVIGLDLALRHPDQIRMLIPHEPPLPQLLPDAEQAEARQIIEELEENHRRAGVLPALKQFSSRLGLPFAGEIGAHQPSAEEMQQFIANMTFLMTYEAPGIRRYTLDVDKLKMALKAAPMQILPAGGSTSKEYFPYHCAAALAAQLGAEIVAFPGDHVGYTIYHEAFAARLHDVLSGTVCG